MIHDYWKQLTTNKAVKLCLAMESLRNEYAAPGEPVSMTDVWQDLADPSFQETDEYITTIKIYSGDKTHDRKAGVVAFDQLITLIVTKRFWALAQQHEMLQNFLLAHEYAHVVRDHHSRGAVVKHFQLHSSQGVNANIPPNWEEFEANIAAVFFQCGTALFERGISAYELAARFRTDRHYVERLQRLCQTDVFLAEYRIQSRPKERVVL